jgi:hypothetical protein
VRRRDCEPGSLFEIVTERLRIQRDCGIVTSAQLARPPGLTACECADRVVAAQGFTTLGPRWRALDVDAARRALLRILEKDLAYGAEVMAAVDAADLAERWLGLSADPRAFFANGAWAEPRVEPSWDPLTPSTFDAGIVAVDEQRIVLLCVQDED